MDVWNDSEASLAAPRAAFSTNPPRRPVSELPSIGRIDRYALKYRIGQGGVGTVYAAYDPTLSRLIAIKTVQVDLPAEERDGFNALFLAEARAAAGLSHPHIVTVFDAGLSDGSAYIAMELLKGADLRQMRQDGWQPTPTQAAQLVAHVGDALAYAHAHGVVHRDVKPANIFMVGRTHPRVLDFGIARVLIGHPDMPQGPDFIGGSPYYMAPEQLLHLPVDARCDVFSLGVVLYELLTGLRPFRGQTLEQIQAAVLEAQPALASEVVPAVPEALARVAARAMANHPDARYPSAGAMVRELKQWLAQPPATAAPVGTEPPRRRWRTGALVGTLLVAAAGAWLGRRSRRDP